MLRCEACQAFVKVEGFTKHGGMHLPVYKCKRCGASRTAKPGEKI